jgi:hypothetical protein
MCGFITENHFTEAECEFPGIRRFYEQLDRKPSTFLDLVWEYEHSHEGEEVVDPVHVAPSSRRS